MHQPRAFAHWPLSAFEHYMLADDRVDYAMTCHVRYWFSGVFERAAFVEALRRTLARHPLMQARVAGPVRLGRLRSLRWVAEPAGRMPFISWKSAAAPIEAPPGGMRSDLTKDIGLRLWVRETAAETTMLWQFHHSVCDGAGFFAFTEDLLAAYGDLVGAGPLPARAIDPGLLALRDDLGLSRRDAWRRVGKDLRRALKFFRVLPVPLLAPRAGARTTATPDLTAVVRATLGEAEVAALARAAKAGGATLNDALMSGLFRALDAWNQRQDPGGRRRWIRVAMPTDLRLPGEEAMSAANVVSMVFLDRRAEALDEPAALLAGIAAETRTIKHDRMGITLVRVVRALGRVWGGLTLFMRAPLCSATAVLTNLGRPFARSPLLRGGRLAAGGVELVGLETLPPLRKRTRVAVSVNSYGGSMRLTMRYDTTVYGAAQAEEILALYLAQLRRDLT